MIAVEPHAKGAVLPVRAHAGARSTGIRGEQAGTLKVCVTQAPEKGKANRAIARLLAQELGMRSSQILLLSGETSAQKRFLVRGLTAEDLHQRLADLLS